MHISFVSFPQAKSKQALQRKKRTGCYYYCCDFTTCPQSAWWGLYRFIPPWDRKQTFAPRVSWLTACPRDCVRLLTYVMDADLDKNQLRKRVSGSTYWKLLQTVAAHALLSAVFTLLALTCHRCSG